MFPMPNNRLAEGIFRIGEKLREEQIRVKLLELLRNQSKSASEIESDKFAKIQRLLQYAYKYSPFYHERLADIFSGHNFSLENFRKIEPLTKEQLRENTKTIASTCPVSKIYKAKTSGSTGIPLIFPKDTITRAYHYAAMYRGHSWYGTKIGDREARLWGVPVNAKDRMKIRLNDYLLNRFRENEYNLSEIVLEDFYRKVLFYKPKLVMGYGKMLYEFALFLKSKNLDLHALDIKMAKYTSEGLNFEQIKTIQEVFGCDVVSEYGAAETGIISFQCPLGHHHIMSDCVHVEFETINNISGCDNLSEILVTDLNNYSFPIIRYRIGDLVETTGLSCGCGLPFPIIAGVQGRASEIFYVGGKKYHSIIFYYIMKGLANKNQNVLQFKVIQKNPTAFCYQIKCSEPKESINKYIITKTKAEFGDEIEVSIEYCEQIERQAAGKLKDFIAYTE